MHRKALTALLTSVLITNLILVLTLYILQVNPLAMRIGLATLLVMCTVIVSFVLVSIQKFFGERRISSKRLVDEVRIHRAETRLLRAEVQSVSDLVQELQDGMTKFGDKYSAHSAFPVFKDDSAEKDFTSLASQIIQSLSLNEKRSAKSIEPANSRRDDNSELSLGIDKLRRDQKQYQSEMLKHSSMKTKQVLAILEAQNIQLDRLIHRDILLSEEK